MKATCDNASQEALTLQANFQKLFQAIMQTEELVLPIFIHSTQAKAITGAVIVAESVFSQVFGLAAATPAAPPAVTPIQPAA
jgi:hypothetical protein